MILCNADLSYANLAHVDLSYSDLSNADMSNTNLSNSNLSNTCLAFTNLAYANLFRANMFRTDLFSAQLTTLTVEINVFETNFQECVLEGTVFGLTNLGTCLGLHTAEVKSPCTIDFQTLRASKILPKSFLLKIGLPELYIDYLPEFYMDALTLHPVFLSHSWKTNPSPENFTKP